MLSGSVAAVLLAASLGGFAWLGFTARRAEGVDDYLIARGSQGWLTLGLSFLASGMGAWILFAPPEVGAGVGVLGVAGYALGAAAPVVAFAALGRRIRRIAPAGHSITEFVRARFGDVFFLYVGLISVGYMLFFIMAELTAIGGVAEIVSGLDGRWAAIAVATVTLGYTAYGGLRASLRTDQWQAWLILGLLSISVVAIVSDLTSIGEAWDESGGFHVERLGVEVAITLVIAVLTANMFHQGYWQRVWAARDLGSLDRGAALGAVSTFVVVSAVGVVGILAAGSSVGPDRNLVPFFALLTDLPRWTTGVVFVLAVSLVASSVDTLENAIASVLVALRRRSSVATARAITVTVMVPATFVGIQGYSVLRLFLIADLLCAATVVPVLSGLWSKANERAAVIGSAAGIAGAIIPGWISGGSIVDGVHAATFPGGVPTLGPFLWALVASASVTAILSWASSETADLTQVKERTTRLEGA